MSLVVRKSIPIFITFCIGTFLIVDYFFNMPALVPIEKDLTNWGVVILSFAIFLGSIDNIVVHGGNLQKRKLGQWPYSLLFLVLFFILTAIGLTLTPTSKLYSDIYAYTYIPLSATMGGVPLLYLTSAAYRAFKVRNSEVAILLISACVVMLANAPVGEVIWTRLPDVRSWILTVPNMAAMRGITIGTGVAVAIFGLKTLLGRERAHGA